MFMNENARFGVDDRDDDDTMDFTNTTEDVFWSQLSDDDRDSGQATASCSNSFPSASASRDIATIMESSVEHLVMDMSNHEPDTVSTLHTLQQSRLGTPLGESQPARLDQSDRTRRGLLDITNRSQPLDTPKKPSPLKCRRRHQIDRKRPYAAFALHESPLAARSQRLRRRRADELLHEKRISQDGIPAAAQPIRRIQSTYVLEASFHPERLSPEVVKHYSLRTVDKPQVEHTAYRSITGDTLAELINSLSVADFLAKFILIDCRYPFEYTGGHVRNAINVHEPSRIASIFYPNDRENFERINSKIPIFYCEFSKKRGPRMACKLRDHDRNMNCHRYPHLDYPEIYVLDHGYRKFYADEKLHSLCEPSHYVPMETPEFSHLLRLYNQHKPKASRRD